MATVPREDVMKKITDLIGDVVFDPPINSSASFITVGRKLRLWADVPADQQPSAFLVTHREVDERRGLGLLRRRLDLGIWCYCRTDDDTSLGQTYLDTMMEGFEKVFNQPDNDSRGENTLGGLVYWCRIEGRVFKDPGDIDKQAFLLVPLVVEMP